MPGENAREVTASCNALRKLDQPEVRRRGGRQAHLVGSSCSQLEGVGLPGAYPSVRSTRHQHGNACRSSNRNFGESDRLDTGSILMSCHLRQHGALHEVDSTEASLCASTNGDRSGVVDGERVDTAVEGETGVRGEELVDGLSRPRVPEDEGRIFRAGDDLLACAKSARSALHRAR